MAVSRAGAPARGGDRRDSSGSSPQHGSRFATGASLPPNAPSEDETSTSRPGGDTGHVELVLRDLEWFMRAPPPYVRVSARWWGDDLVADAARPWVGLDSARDADATFVFPVVAKPAGFARYCRDAAMLALEFADGRTGRVAAVASVDVSRLDLGRPVLGARALRTRGGATVGSVGVAMRVDFRPDRVSSFERNERLAEAEAAETQAARTRGEESGDESGERLDATSVDGGDGGSADAEQRRRSGDDEEKTSPKREKPKRRGRDVSSGDVSRRAGAARARLRENPSLAERGRAARRRESLWERERMPRDAVEACELLRREIDEALALDGAEAARMIDEEIARASPSPPGRSEAAKSQPGTDDAGSRYDAWVRAAASQISRASVRSSGETTRSERDAATAWLGGTEDDPDGVGADVDDAAACAEEALVCALARFSDGGGDEKKSASADDDENSENLAAAAPCADATTERCIASAAATAFTDAQLDDVDGPPPDPDIELRLTLHDGSVRVLDGLDDDDGGEETEKKKKRLKHLAVIVKGGHPFPAGELARVALEGVGPRGAGTARVALPSAVADAIVDPAKSTPVMALEVWDPEALAEEGRFGQGETEGAPRRGSDSRESDAADVSFAALFGDFARADPRAVRGVVAVRLDALSNDVRRARRRAAENRRWGLARRSDAFIDGLDGVANARDAKDGFKTPSVSFDGSPLNRVFEVRGVFDGAVNGFLGVEAGVVNDRVHAQRH